MPRGCADIGAMPRPDRIAEGTPEADRERFERIGYSRCEADEAERLLASLRQKQLELRDQIAAVGAENRTLERDLLQQLGTWRKLDDAHQRVEDVLPQLKAVTSSLVYRLVAGLLGVVNRVRCLLLPSRSRPR